MKTRRLEPRPGFERWARVAAAVVSLLLLGFGVLSVFKTEAGVASTALIVVGGVLGYVALANDRIREFSTSGVAFFEREAAEFVEETLSSLDAPPEVQEYLAERFEPHLRELPEDVQREVRAATERAALTKGELLAELCDELGIARLPLGQGSSLPAAVFRQAASVVGVSSDGPMPVVAGRIVASAGALWTSSDWSRGSTVTSSGLGKVLDAVRLHKRAGESTVK